MDEMPKIKKILASLLAMESQPDWSLSNWQSAAEDVFKLAKRQGSDIPELVWHYLSDADIRIKDADYAQHQIFAVKDFVGLNNTALHS